MKKHIFRSIRFFLLAGAATGCLFPAAETAAYDFADYVPTLDRRHALTAQDPAYSADRQRIYPAVHTGRKRRL